MEYFALAWLLTLIPFATSALIPPNQLLGNQYGVTGRVVPGHPVTGSTTMNSISSSTGLDGPQISFVNTTSWEWWYFDAVSPDLKSGVSIVFYTALSTGFPFLYPQHPVTTVTFSCTFPNGTSFSVALEASEAIIATVDNGSLGTFVGAGASWFGTPDISLYQVIINSPANGLTGTFILRSRAPAHYPCSKAKSGQTMLMGSHIGWSNAIPDATGLVDFKVLGSRYAWTGNAYHDKNWSNQPFEENVGSWWYWGHGRLGGYSLVWFDYLSSDGTEHVSAYAAKDGNIVATNCQPGSARVRPLGTNHGDFTISLDLGSAGTLEMTVKATTVLEQLGPFYSRWTGKLEGNLNGGNMMTGGVAMFESFNLD